MTNNPKSEEPDVRLIEGLLGSPTMLEIRTQKARDWVKTNLPTEGWMWLGNRLFANYFDIPLVLSNMEGDGLTIQY